MIHNDFGKVVNSRLFERSHLIGIDSKSIKDNINKEPKKKVKKKKFGEVTGYPMRISSIDKGLPLRIGVTEYKRNDSFGERKMECDVLNDNQFIENAEPEPEIELLNICSNNSNAFGFAFFDFLSKYTKNICISPFLIILIFGSLFICSEDDNFMNFFYFPKRKQLFEGLNEILLTLGQIKFINLLLSNEGNEQIESINNFIKIIEVDKNINTILNKMSNGLLRNCINKVDSLTGINLIYIKTEWKYKFQSIVDDNIVGLNMIGSYYKNDRFKCLELMLNDGVNVMGFIQTNEITFIDLKKIISNLQMIEFKKIVIPMFKRQYKYKLLNSIRKMGLNSSFDSNEIQGELTDLMHYVFIEIDGNGGKICKHQKESKVSFILQAPFIYYIRNIVSDIILIIGRIA